MDAPLRTFPRHRRGGRSVSVRLLNRPLSRRGHLPRLSATDRARAMRAARCRRRRVLANGRREPSPSGRLLSWQRHSGSGAAARAEAVVARPGRRTLGCWRLRHHPEFAGPPIASKHDHVLRRHNPIDGRRDLDHRAAAWPGAAVISSPAGTRAAPFRPIHQRRARRQRWLLRQASGSQVRLQLAADRAAGKHIGRSRNRWRLSLKGRASRRGRFLVSAPLVAGAS